MKYIDAIKHELDQYVDNEKAKFLPKFFKTNPGEYGEGDKFIGVTVPKQRKVAKKYFQAVKLDEVEKLLREPIHEYRLTALFILVYKYEKAEEEAIRESIVKLYLGNIPFINNWDLVDSSADKILGAYLFNRNRDTLYELADADDIWSQRIAIISTFYFIKNQQFEDTLNIAKRLLNHKHDLIHKAVGWMLREIGNRDFEVEYNFLKENYKRMPRTMLRYAIEKFDEELRQKFLKGFV